MTKYAAIATSLRSSIECGTYAPGDKLPTMDELCLRYGVSKITIRRALDELEHCGLVARRRGSGTYVREGEARMPTHASEFDDLSPLPADVASPSHSDFVVLHSICVIHPTENEAQSLHMDEEEFVYELIRTRTVCGITRVAERTIIPLRLCPTLRGSDVTGSLHRFLLDRHSSRVASVHQIVSAVHPDERETKWFGIGSQEALVSVRQVAYLDNGVPCALTTATHAPGYVFRSLSTK